MMTITTNIRPAAVVITRLADISSMKTTIQIVSTFLCIGLLSITQAVIPTPDGGYPGGNTAEGQGALDLLAGGFNNTAIGFNALFNLRAGDYNTAVGHNALLLDTGGFQNTAVGSSALEGNRFGVNNTAVGFGALHFNTASQNTATGAAALYNNTTAH